MKEEMLIVPERLISDLKKIGYEFDGIPTPEHDVIQELIWNYEELYKLYPDKILPDEIFRFVVNLITTHLLGPSNYRAVGKEIYVGEYTIFCYVIPSDHQPIYDWNMYTIIGKCMDWGGIKIDLKRDIGPLLRPQELMILDKIERAEHFSPGISSNTLVVSGVTMGDLIKALVGVESYCSRPKPSRPIIVGESE